MAIDEDDPCGLREFDQGSLHLCPSLALLGGNNFPVFPVLSVFLVIALFDSFKNIFAKILTHGA